MNKIVAALAALVLATTTGAQTPPAAPPAAATPAQAAPPAEPSWVKGERFVSVAADTQDVLQRIHDDEANVTCWVIRSPRGIAIDCLPDQQIRRVPAAK